MSSVAEAVQIFKGKEEKMLFDFGLNKVTVFGMIYYIRKTKSLGPDDIYLRFLWVAKDLLMKPTDIFRNLLDTGTLNLKGSLCIVSIQDRGQIRCQTTPPISLASVIMKHFESAIAKKISVITLLNIISTSALNMGF